MKGHNNGKLRRAAKQRVPNEITQRILNSGEAVTLRDGVIYHSLKMTTVVYQKSVKFDESVPVYINRYQVVRQDKWIPELS